MTDLLQEVLRRARQVRTDGVCHRPHVHGPSVPAAITLPGNRMTEVTASRYVRNIMWRRFPGRRFAERCSIGVMRQNRCEVITARAQARNAFAEPAVRRTVRWDALMPPTSPASAWWISDLCYLLLRHRRRPKRGAHRAVASRSPSGTPAHALRTAGLPRQTVLA